MKQGDKVIVTTPYWSNGKYATGDELTIQTVSEFEGMIYVKETNIPLYSHEYKVKEPV